MKFLPLPILLLALAVPLRGADTDTATNAINSLGIDLLKTTGKPDANALLSPYSIQEALAMTYAGAAGKTREEMGAALHFPEDGSKLNKSFAALEKELAEIEADTRKIVAGSKENGGPSEPVTISVANRLYGQEGYDFRENFLELVKKDYDAPLAEVDFKHAPEKARGLINGWVAGRTHNRIEDLVPEGGIKDDTRLVLVNAIYLKAAWADNFETSATQPAPFHVDGKDAQNVPMMQNASGSYGYARRDGCTAVSIPYLGSGLQFLVLLPDRANGLAALEAKLTPAMLADCANLKPALVRLWLPKFRMEPPSMDLGGQLQSLGMQTAFDKPRGSANFDGIVPRRPDHYLYIWKVFHKTFLSLDEHGTEAAAATAVVMPAVEGIPSGPPPRPREVHVDHPFLFAIQDCKNGACLFIGRVTDPGTGKPGPKSPGPPQPPSKNACFPV